MNFRYLSAVAFIPSLVNQLRKPAMIDAQTLHQRIENKEDVLLLDVRTSEEFQNEVGHIKGTQNIPLDTLVERSSELIDFQDRPVVIVCLAERRSIKAASILRKAGFSKLSVLQGGMKQWNEEFNIETKNTAGQER